MTTSHKFTLELIASELERTRHCSMALEGMGRQLYALSASEAPLTLDHSNQLGDLAAGVLCISDLLDRLTDTLHLRVMDMRGDGSHE